MISIRLARSFRQLCIFVLKETGFHILRKGNGRKNISKIETYATIISRPCTAGIRLPARHAAFKAHPSRPIAAPIAAIPAGINLVGSAPRIKLPTAAGMSCDCGMAGVSEIVAFVVAVFTSVVLLLNSSVTAGVVDSLISKYEKKTRNQIH